MAEETTLTSPEQLQEQQAAAMRLPQEVTITDAGPCKKHVKVVVDRAAIDTRIDEKFSDMMLNTKSRLAVPGFRPGKAPRKIIQKKFEKDVLIEVRNEVLMASLEQLAEEEKLSPLAPPELDPAAVIIPEFGPMVYEFDIEVRPEFDLPEYKGLKLKRLTHTVTDDEVKQEANRMLERLGTIVPKTSKPEVEMGDFVTADLEVIHDGKPLNKRQEVRVRINERLALQDGVAEKFAEQMIGAKVGEDRKVDIKLSQALANEELRGVTVQATFSIKEIKVMRLPELTPAVLGQFNCANEEQFHEYVRTRLERYFDYQSKQNLRTQVLVQLTKDAKWDLPRDLLTRQARRVMQRRVMELQNSGLTEQEILAQRRVLEQDAIRTTAASLQEHFVLQKIAEVEKIEIDDNEIDAEIERIADESDESPRKVRARLEREDMIEALATELLERRALQVVLDHAIYEEGELVPDSTRQAVGTAEVEAVQQ